MVVKKEHVLVFMVVMVWHWYEGSHSSWGLHELSFLPGPKEEEPVLSYQLARFGKKGGGEWLGLKSVISQK